MKKHVLLLAVLTMVLLTACGNTDAKNENSNNNSEASIQEIKRGYWNDDKTEYINAVGEKFTAKEYEKMLCMTGNEDTIDFMDSGTVDFYLRRTDFDRNDGLVIYMRDIKWSYDIKYTYYNFEVKMGNYDPYKVVAKSTLDENLYNTMKDAFANSNVRTKYSVNEFYKLISDEDKAEVGATTDFVVYGGNIKTTSFGKDTQIVSAGLFNDNTKEMIIYYYNPALESEYVEYPNMGE